MPRYVFSRDYDNNPYVLCGGFYEYYHRLYVYECDDEEQLNNMLLSNKKLLQELLKIEVFKPEFLNINADNQVEHHNNLVSIHSCMRDDQSSFPTTDNDLDTGLNILIEHYMAYKPFHLLRDCLPDISYTPYYLGDVEKCRKYITQFYGSETYDIIIGADLMYDMPYVYEFEDQNPQPSLYSEQDENELGRTIRYKLQPLLINFMKLNQSGRNITLPMFII